jgi:hypothetical protein
MTTATKVSSCVDCGTPIIGDRPRCPACHDLHAPRGVASYQEDAADDAVTAPRSRQRVRGVNQGPLARRAVVAIEVLGIVVLALVILVKGCS